MMNVIVIYGGRWAIGKNNNFFEFFHRVATLSRYVGDATPLRNRSILYTLFKNNLNKT